MTTNKNSKSTIVDIYGKSYNEIKGLFEKSTLGDEFELIFKNPNGKYYGQEKYILLLKYLKMISQNKITQEDTLDVNFSVDNNESYRATIHSKENINKYIAKLDLWKPHVIFSSLVNLAEQKAPGITLEKKSRTEDNIIDVEDLLSRFKLSSEEQFTKKDFELTKSIGHDNMDKITFRLKQRSTIFIRDTKDDFIKIDLTMTKTTKNYKQLNQILPSYELEIEYGLRTKSKPDDLALTMLLEQSLILHKIIQQSNYIMTQSMITEVLQSYKNIANLDDKAISLDARQPISLEIQYLTEIIPNKYAVTDKADGDRYLLIIVK